MEVRAVGRCGDAPRPGHKIEGAAKIHTTEEVSSAAIRPRFRDQSATSETGFVGAEVVKNLVDDLNGYVNCGPIVLEAAVCKLPGVVKTGGGSRWVSSECPLAPTTGKRVKGFWSAVSSLIT